VPPLYAHDPFLAIQGLMALPWLDPLMAALATVCEGWALAALALSWRWIAERDLRRGARSAAPMVLALLFTGLLVQVVKAIVGSPRPLSVFGAAQVHVVLEPLYQGSFPSGHSAAVASLAASATVLLGWRAAWLWVLVLLGGLSRVLVGAHWTTDVVGGWALGTALGWLVARWSGPAPISVSRFATWLDRVLLGRGSGAAPSPDPGDP